MALLMSGVCACHSKTYHITCWDDSREEGSAALPAEMASMSRQGTVGVQERSLEGGRLWHGVRRRLHFLTHEAEHPSSFHTCSGV